MAGATPGRNDLSAAATDGSGRSLILAASRPRSSIPGSMPSSFRETRSQPCSQPPDSPCCPTTAAGSGPMSSSSRARNLVTPRVRRYIANLPEMFSAPWRDFMDELNQFAAPLGLREFRTWSKIWEYPALWNARPGLHRLEPLPAARHWQRTVRLALVAGLAGSARDPDRDQ
jgi:hypothetical protein